MHEDLARLELRSDVELVDATRNGSNDAFAELWKRHSRAATGFAGTFRNLADPDDVVSEAYIRVFTAIKAGGGPSGVFRAYLLTAVRNTALNWGRTKQREIAHEDFDVFLGSDSAEELALQALERSTTSRAFTSLSPRFQEVLWYSEVEHLPRTEIGTILGIKPNAVSQLTFRARDALRTAWLQEHIKRDDLEPECAAVAGLIAGYVRDTINRRQRKQVEDHAHDCAGCLIVIEEANHIAERLTLVVLPLAVGLTGAAAYQALVPVGAAAAATLGATVMSGKAAAGPPLWGIATLVGAGTITVVAIAAAFAGTLGTNADAGSPPPTTRTHVTTPAPPTPSPTPSPPAPRVHASAPAYAQPNAGVSTAPPAPTLAPALAMTPATARTPAPTPTPTPEPTGSPVTTLPAPVVRWDIDPADWLLPSASGTAVPGSTVEIADDGVIVTTIGVGPGGSWSTAALPLLPGVHQLSATQLSPAGLRSASTDPVQVTLQQPTASVTRTGTDRAEVRIITPAGLHVVSADPGCSVINVDHGLTTTTFVHCLDLPALNATVTFFLASDTGALQTGPVIQIPVPDASDESPPPAASPTPTPTPTPTPSPTPSSSQDLVLSIAANGTTP